MKRCPLVLLLCLAACAAPGGRRPEGIWTGSVTAPDGDSHDLRFDFRVAGESLTGTVIGPPSVDSAPAIQHGHIAGGQVAFDVTTKDPDGNTVTFKFSGKINEGHMEGTIEDPEGHRFPFTAGKGDAAGSGKEDAGEKGSNVVRAPDNGPHMTDDHVPPGAAGAVLDAFAHYEVVALGILSYANQDYNNFILSLIRNPALPGKVNDIVVECGNALYQPLLDRYISGDNVTLTEARQVWRNTTQPMCGVASFYEQLFPLVRQVNMTLAPERRLRVLAGDPPDDWGRMKSRQDVSAFMDRDSSIASVMETEVLAKHRKALMIFGIRHLTHGGGGAVSRYERKGYPNVTFVVMAHNGIGNRGKSGNDNTALEKRMADWPVPSLIPIKGSWLADLDFGAVMPDERGSKLASRVDGYLYLGPRDLLLNEPIPAAVVLDKAYMEELQRRAAGVGSPMRGDAILKEATEAGVFFYTPSP